MWQQIDLLWLLLVYYTNQSLIEVKNIEPNLTYLLDRSYLQARLFILIICYMALMNNEKWFAIVTDKTFPYQIICCLLICYFVPI